MTLIYSNLRGYVELQRGLSSEKEVKGLLAQWNKSKKMMRGMKGNRQFRRQMQSMMDVDDIELG